MKAKVNYSVSVSFQNVSLPPFEDVLILTRKSQFGKIGLSGSINLLQPDVFEILEFPENELVEMILVNKRILKRIPQSTLLHILEQKVFPYITIGEIVKVDFKVKIAYESIDINIQDTNHES